MTCVKQVTATEQSEDFFDSMTWPNADRDFANGVGFFQGVTDTFTFDFNSNGAFSEVFSIGHVTVPSGPVNCNAHVEITRVTDGAPDSPPEMVMQLCTPPGNVPFCPGATVQIGTKDPIYGPPVPIGGVGVYDIPFTIAAAGPIQVLVDFFFSNNTAPVPGMAGFVTFSVV